MSRPVVVQPMLAAAAVESGRNLGEIVSVAAGDCQAQNFPGPGTERTQWEVAQSFPDGWPLILTWKHCQTVLQAEHGQKGVNVR